MTAGRGGHDGEVGRLRSKWHRLGEALYNNIVTYVPSHNLRAAILRMFGARVGKASSFLRGTTVFGIERLVVGDEVSIGYRCVLDARGGLTISSNVVIASDVHFVAAQHEIESDEFEARFFATSVGDHAWIAVRSTILAPASIGRGAVVSACALVTKDVAERAIVRGVPAVEVGTRGGGLAYSTRFRPLFS